MTMNTPATSRPKRPFRVSVLAVIFLILSLLGWLRLGQALINRQLLTQLGAWPGPVYIALGGLVWGAAGLPVALGLWSRASWSGSAARLAALIFLLTYWIDRLWFSAERAPVYNWPFSLGVSAAWLILVYWITSNPSIRPANDRRIGERDDKNRT